LAQREGIQNDLAKTCNLACKKSVKADNCSGNLTACFAQQKKLAMLRSSSKVWKNEQHHDEEKQQTLATVARCSYSSDPIRTGIVLSLAQF